jgi:hypothetical protein
MEPMQQPTDLAIRKTLTDLVGVYETECANVRTAYAALQVAEVALQSAFSKYTRVLSERSYNPERAVTDVIAGITKDAWCVILERIEMRKIASVKRWEEISKKIDDDAMPALTLTNVYDLLQAYAQNMPEIQREAAMEAYGILTPGARARGQKLVTNVRYGVGPKVILSSFVENGYASKFRVNYYRRTDLVQVDRVFHMLDGKGVMDGYTSPLADAIETSADGTGMTDYFEFRACHNCNLHLRFLRPDLVAVLNAVAADGYSLKQGKKAA